MTLVSTKYNRAENWSQRLPLARDIMAEVRAEQTPKAAEDMSFEELEAATRPEVAQ